MRMNRFRPWIWKKRLCVQSVSKWSGVLLPVALMKNWA